MTIKKSPVGKHIYYEGLTQPVTAAELQEYRRSLPESSRFGRVAVPVLAGGALAVFSVTMFIRGLLLSSVGLVVVGTIIGLVAAGSVYSLLSWQKKKDEITIRLRRFTFANGWRYTEQTSALTHQGMIFQQGYARLLQNVISQADNPEVASFEIGDYQYVTGSGKNRRTYYWTYCSIELDRHVPHMVLDAKANDFRLFGKSVASNLPETFKRDQVLALEGDFNNYFTLYAPEAYKRDAYYIFTPDLMALLIDHSYNFDAEVIDNRLYIYTRRHSMSSSLVDPQFIYKLISIIHTVGMSMYRRTDYYADEAVANRAVDAVAAPGRRLKSGLSWIVIVALILVVVVNVLPLILDLLVR